MTEKKYVYMDLLETEAISVNDDECYYFNEYGTVKKVCGLLNEQSTKITELEDLIKYKNTVQQETLNKMLTTQKENQTIRNLIKNMMDNERTHIGYNTLKQLWEALP